MYSDTGDTTSLVPGFPIRTSSDPRSVDSSPRHNAASHVLHRLPVPRHPPCALKHLQHKKPEKNKKLHHNKPHNPRQTPTGPTQAATPRKESRVRPDARNHYPQIKHHTPPPRWSDTRPSPRRKNVTIPGFPHSGRRDGRPVASKPNSVSGSPPPRPAPKDPPQQRF